MKLLPLLLVLASCGDDREPAPDPLTWGEASSAVAIAYCERRLACDHIVEAVEVCIEHTEFHFCLAGTCDVALPVEAAIELDACLVAMADANCSVLAWGVVPSECWVIMEREP